MNVKQLRAFLAVAQYLSFAQAGERLNLSQPALSLTIKSLEEDLGGQLLTRTTRNVSLTPEGETLLPLARQLMADWDNTEELLRQRFTLQMGRVSIAAMPSFAGNLLPGALKTFRGRYPRVNVAVHDVVNEQVLEMVRHRRVELGIGFEPESSNSLSFTPFYMDRFVAVVSTESSLAGRAEVSWADLLNEDFIALQRRQPCACCWSTPSSHDMAGCQWHSRVINCLPSGAWSPTVWVSARCLRCALNRCRSLARVACRWWNRVSSGVSG